MRQHEYRGPTILEIGYKVLFNERLVENQKDYSTKVLGKAPSYYSCMMARRRSPTLMVVRRLRDYLQNLLMGFVGNPHIGSKYAVELNQRHRRLTTLLNTVEEEIKQREAIKDQIELPDLVYNRYDPVEALFRIAEIFTVLGISRDDRDFSVRVLDMDTGFLADLGNGSRMDIPASAANSLIFYIEDKHRLEAESLAAINDKHQLWRARARYNLLQMAMDLFGSFIKSKSTTR